MHRKGKRRKGSSGLQSMEEKEAAQGNGGNMTFVTLVSSIAAIGGLLFGFDTAVVSGAIGFMKLRFDLNEMQVGWAVSSLIVGCILGAAVSGWFSDKFGRKKVLIAAAVLFVASSVGSAVPETFAGYAIARMIGGIGIGITSTLCPLYNAEIAPAAFRGRLVALNQFATVTGIFLVYFVNTYIAGLGNDAWDIESAWRWMFGVGVVPGVLFLILLFFVPESPRWLVKQGRAAEALPILIRIHGEAGAKREALDIQASFREGEAPLRDLFRPGLRFALFVGVGLAVLQQVTGINAVMYYAPEIFKQAGAGTNASLVQTILVGFVNFAFTILAIWLIDKVGRKALLLAGASLMAVSLFVIGTAFQTGYLPGGLVLTFILIYVASFAISLGPVVWVMLSEIFPNRYRGRATAIAAMSLWIADYVVSQSFPPLLVTAGPGATFYLFALLSVATVLFTWKAVPETKGKSLEDMEALWAKPVPQTHAVSASAAPKSV